MKRFERFWSQGRHSKQAHRDLPEGTFEREMGRDGFDGPASHIYHPRPPTNWTSIDGPLKPRAFNLNMVEESANPFAVPTLLTSASLRIAYWQTSESMPHLVRDADGDELLFVHSGSMQFFCDYGHMEVDDGSYLVIPRGTMWRVETAGLLSVLLLSVAGDRFHEPTRGLLGRHALWDPGVLEYPKLNEQFRSQTDTPSSVLVRRREQLSTIHYDHNPLDAVGWKGDTVPVRLHVHDLLPINSHRYHLPPSVHATFECDAALVSTFVPRPFETDQTALKVPFFHNNDDIDEVIFYHAGNFFSRDAIETGCLTYHPSGLTHGPHPKALARMFEQPNDSTNEYAVMIDSREQLEVSTAALNDQIEIAGYDTSWRIDST
ncbi:MAG: homogentisate 1,2-dioxygenase [Gammaproteobacteria bacterium]|nr:homogentisate 1,2-dioxygenase [Gammaproteobacteria bacterium]